MEDKISSLPDGVKGLIVSSLPIRESVNTDCLSSLWRGIWRGNRSRSLDLMNSLSFRAVNDTERASYVRWVNAILNEFHFIKNLPLFRIVCELRNFNADDINRWLAFAIDRNVSHLELNFASEGLQSIIQGNSYELPQNIITVEFGRFLKSLVLRDVVVNQETMKILLEEFQCLERLTVDGNAELDNLKCAGPNVTLKNLTIQNWDGLQAVELSRFKFVNLQIQIVDDLVLNDCGELRILNLVGGDSPQKFLSTHLSAFTQLESLRFTTHDAFHLEAEQNFVEDMRRLNLGFPRKLDMTVIVFEDRRLCFLVEILQSLPTLEEFILRVPSSYLDKPSIFDVSEDDTIESCQSVANLKCFRFFGYASTRRDVEIVCVLAKSACQLESIELVIIPAEHDEYQYLKETKLVAEKQVDLLKRMSLISSTVGVYVSLSKVLLDDGV